MKFFNDTTFAGRVAILGAVVQDGQRRPSDITVADRWQKKHSLPFIVAADPAAVLLPYYEDPNVLPMNLVVRTSDMSIRWAGMGNQAAAIRREIEAVLKSPNP